MNSLRLRHFVQQMTLTVEREGSNETVVLDGESHLLHKVAQTQGVHGNGRRTGESKRLHKLSATPPG